MTDCTKNFAVLHDAMPDEAHTCPEYGLDAEGCYRAERCLDCGTCREEHADQSLPHRYSDIDITDHPFRGLERLANH